MHQSKMKKVTVPEINLRFLRYVVGALIFVVFLVMLFQSYNYKSLYSWKSLNVSGNISHPHTELQLCPITPKELVGRFFPDKHELNLDIYDEQFESAFKPGGYYKPTKCISRDRVAIIAPVRKRDEQIPIFLKNLHPLLMRQQIEHQIFMIHQAPGYWFNRGALLNAGFIEAMKVRKWDCFIFHDVDTLPIDDRNLYICPRMNPRHMATGVDKHNFKLLYDEFFGTVYAFNTDQYLRINGHSNSFWGWGGEDNDIFARIKNAGYTIERSPLDIAKYISLPHKIESTYNHQWAQQVSDSHGTISNEGLSSIKYHIKKIKLRNTFTSILVDLVPEELGRNSTEVKELNEIFKSENY